MIIFDNSIQYLNGGRLIIIMILNIIIAILLYCSSTFQTSLEAKSWKINISPDDEICVNSSLARTVFVFGSAPGNVKYNVYEYGTEKIESDIRESSIIFAINSPSYLSFNCDVMGDITFSAVSLDQHKCLDGIYVTNEVSAQYTSMERPIILTNQRCFFLASYGEQIVKTKMNLSRYDAVEYSCNNSIKEISPLSKSFDVNCSNKDTPYFATVNTSPWEDKRQFQMNFDVKSNKPYRPMSIERLMTPKPTVVEVGFSALSIILVVLSIVFLLAILGCLGYIIYARFFKKYKKLGLEEELL